MKAEYLIFNLIVISGPLYFGSKKQFYFIDKWKHTIVPILLPAIIYIIWDSLVTNSHWNFNHKYVLGVKLFNLPIEEIFFFLTVPFACLFTWEMIKKRTDPKSITKLRFIYLMSYTLMPLGFMIFVSGKEYTGLAIMFLGASIILDQLLKTNLLLQKRFFFYLLVVLLFTLLFNGYLTWRPVVTYGIQYQLDFRVFTIPIEDFIYGISLIIMNTVIYQKILSRNYLLSDSINDSKDYPAIND